MIHDLKTHSPRTNPGSKPSLSTTLPFLSQIAEEDLTSASTSVTSFHLPNSIVRRNNQPPARTLSDQDLFTRVSEDNNTDVGQETTKPISYAHFNFDQSNKQQLTKGNSMMSMSSESVDVPIHSISNPNGDLSRRKIQMTSPPNDSSPGESSPALMKNNKIRLRKQTQEIAARAAQRRANLHHKELMEDMGSAFSSEPVASKENTASAFGLEITSVKPKKTVTINDPATSKNRNDTLRRTNSDSPELINHESTLNETFSTVHNRPSKTLSTKKRSISHGSTVNARTNIPVANIVVPREHF